MRNTFNIEKTFKTKAERNWHTVYFAVDLHGTLIRPGHDKVEFYPCAVEVVKWINSRTDCKIILWTSSHQSEISNFLYECARNEIHMDFINENPLEGDSARACFDKKFYFNVLLDDKAGFDGEIGWALIKQTLIELGEWYPK